MSMAWFRFYHEFSADPKVQSMSEALQRRLVMLFCLQAKGELAQLGEDEIAFALRLDIETLHETLRVFQSKGFCDEKGQLLNWEKRQFRSDNSTARVKKYREKTKAVPKEAELKRFSNGEVTPPDTDSDKDTDSESISPLPPRGESEGFSDFCSVFPSARFGSRAKAQAAYEQAVLLAGGHGPIMAGLRAYIASGEPTREGGRYACSAATWLAEDRWANSYGGKAAKQAPSDGLVSEDDYRRAKKLITSMPHSQGLREVIDRYDHQQMERTRAHA